MVTHFRHVCEDHGTMLAQCRCPSDHKVTTQQACPGPPVCPQPGFRVTPCEMDDTTALEAMHQAADVVVKAALDARLGLLRLGFADDHSLTLELDRTAAQYAVVQGVLRRQAQARPEDVGTV
jgi:hypothetical protein